MYLELIISGNGIGLWLGMQARAALAARAHPTSKKRPRAASQLVSRLFIAVITSLVDHLDEFKTQQLTSNGRQLKLAYLQSQFTMQNPVLILLSQLIGLFVFHSNRNWPCCKVELMRLLWFYSWIDSVSFFKFRFLNPESSRM